MFRRVWFSICSGNTMTQEQATMLTWTNVDHARYLTLYGNTKPQWVNTFHHKDILMCVHAGFIFKNVIFSQSREFPGVGVAFVGATNDNLWWRPWRQGCPCGGLQASSVPASVYLCFKWNVCKDPLTISCYLSFIYHIAFINYAFVYV